jgi:uncharacterized protein YndB with AHSA1/START domain
MSKISDTAVIKATGKGLEEWFALFDRAGAKGWDHKQRARWLYDNHLPKEWWCQTVTVEYERERGLRVMGETVATGFEIGVRKSLPISPESAWSLITSAEGVAAWLGEGVDLNFVPGESYRTTEGATGEIRTVLEGTRLRLSWQPKDWAKPSIVQIYLEPNKTGTSVGFHQEKLANAEVREGMRARWQKALSNLEELANEG